MGCVDLHSALAVHSVHGVGGEGSGQPHLSNASREGHLDCSRNLVSVSCSVQQAVQFFENFIVCTNINISFTPYLSSNCTETTFDSLV